VTDAVQIALIAATPPTLVALGAIIVAWRNGRKTDELKVTVDGRLTQLLEAADAKEKATAISSEALGVLKEKERQNQK
jgi:hypothetical protein